MAFLTGILGDFSKENAVAWLKSIIIAVALALLIRWPVAEPFKIPSGSMIPTLKIGDRLFVNKFVYGVRFPLNRCRIPFTSMRINYANKRLFRWKDPQRWDVVVFKAVPEEAMHTTLVKRIVALPGERVHIEDGKICINGEALALPDYMPDIFYTSSGSYGVLTDDEYAVVPEDCYLALGDNSSNSKDGRMFGWLPNEYILGRVSSIWWPIGNRRDMTGFTQTLWWRTLLTVLGLLAFVRLFVGRSWKERTGALVRTVARGERLYVSRLPFGIPLPFTSKRITAGRPPERGEIVLYFCPGDSDYTGELVLGRIAGLPGERVYLNEGHLNIDGAKLEEPSFFAKEDFQPSEGTGDFGRTKSKTRSLVPDHHYFVLVDEDEECPDSRTHGWVPHENLVGVATMTGWPFLPRRLS